MASYWLDEDTFIQLRDSKGRFTTLARAKSFHIYEEGSLFLSGEFPRISDNVSDKLDYIYYFYIEFLASQDLDKIEDTLDELEAYDDDSSSLEIVTDQGEVLPVDEASYSDLRSAKERIELERKLFEDLILEIEDQDPELGEELREEYLVDEMYKELRAEFVSDELNRRFKVKIPSEIFVEEGEFISGPFSNHEFEKFYYTFDRPFEWRDGDPKSVFTFFENQMSGAAKMIVQRLMEKGKGRFIFRLTYYKFDGNKLIPTGVGPSRFEKENYDPEDFYDLLSYILKNKLNQTWENYIMSNQVVYISGFSLENITR